MSDSSKSKFLAKVLERVNEKSSSNTVFLEEKVNMIISSILHYDTNVNRSANDYNWKTYYEVFYCDDVHILRRKGTTRQVLPV